MHLLAAVLIYAAATVSASARITEASYSEPTSRYDHAVLGDAVEWGALDLTLDDGRVLRFKLPETLVFEDLAPRLADLDGDGSPEVITVESSLSQGARLAVWGQAGHIAATDHYGQPHRWLSPAGAADLDGDGTVEIAYIDRPHLLHTLRLVSLQDGRLVERASAPNLTNHRIGDDFIQGGLLACKERTLIVTATGDWTSVALTGFDGLGLVTVIAGDYSGPESLVPRPGLCP